MSQQALGCHVYDRAGNELTGGSCLFEDESPAPEVVVTALDRPGQLIQRCLLGGMRELWLHLRDGRLVPGRLEQIYFQPDVGRVCVIRMREALSLPGATPEWEGAAA
jgi:hypothetical protein